MVVQQFIYLDNGSSSPEGLKNLTFYLNLQFLTIRMNTALVKIDNTFFCIYISSTIRTNDTKFILCISFEVLLHLFT